MLHKIYLKYAYEFCVAFLPAPSTLVNITCTSKESTGNFSPGSFFKVRLGSLIGRLNPLKLQDLIWHGYCLYL